MRIALIGEIAPARAAGMMTAKNAHAALREANPHIVDLKRGGQFRFSFTAADAEIAEKFK